MKTRSNPMSIDWNIFQKTEAEKANVATAKSNFKRNGLQAWNERNRPGNNK